MEALELLKTLDKPVGVLSICGPLRSGKSTFMSLVAGGKEVFKSSPILQPCTNGIWLSTTALECDEYILLFVNTEGINAVWQIDNIIEPIVSLIFPISSQLIYNMMHIVMQSDVSQIRYVRNSDQSDFHAMKLWNIIVLFIQYFCTYSKWQQNWQKVKHANTSRNSHFLFNI